VQSGAVDFQYRNTRNRGQVVDGTLVVLEPGEAWSNQAEELSFSHVFIDPAWFQEVASEQLHWEKSLPHFPSQTFFDPSLSRAVHDLARGSQAPASRLQQEETLLHLLALLLSHAEDARTLPQPSWEYPAVKRAKDYLQAHYAQEVSLQELAGVVCMSPFHLARVFRQVVGLPPHAYQTQLRLARARTLLAQGYDVGYVAHETGFFDQSHFTQQFKRRFLVTPGSYRKTARFS
jgi:AraC-like DNA-binding protein